MALNPNELIAKIAGESQAGALMERYQSLTELARADELQLQEIPGIGPAKASAIKCALTLAQKLAAETLTEAPLLDTPERVADLLREYMRLRTVETFVVVLLNVRRRLIKYIHIADGTLDTLLVHPREVFKTAILANAAAIVVAHNHNSGICEPSEADIRVTRDLIRAGQLLKIQVLDHIILGSRTTERPKDFVSLRELGHFFS